jgi:hypothetical protein
MARCKEDLLDEPLHLPLHHAGQLGQDVTHLVDLTTLAKKKAHLLCCTQSSRSNEYASARRFLVRLASETFLNSLESKFFNTPFACVLRASAQCDILADVSNKTSNHASGNYSCELTDS